MYVKSFMAGCPGMSLVVEMPASVREFLVHEEADAELFERQRTIVLSSTPEGECRLLAYRRRTMEGIEPPMRLISVVSEMEKERLDVTIRLLAAGVPDTAAVTNLEITCVLTGKAVDISGAGGGELVRDGRAVQWRVKKLVGGQEISLKAKLHHPSGGATMANFRAVVVALNFEISMFTVGGVQVKQLTVDGFTNPNRWVRYVTQANNYVFRL
jgi:AP-4 complex subunit mu-1